MKCPYCSGEVSSQSITCPYCGRENPEGIAFQEEVRQRIERNKLLKPFLIKQKTPELVQRMLSRMVIIIFIGNVLLFALAIAIYVWFNDDGSKREPMPGSYAEYYMETFKGVNDYTGHYFWDDVLAAMDLLDNGEVPDAEQVESLVYYARYALEHCREADELESVYEIEVAFFRGYLGLSEEDSIFLEPNEEGEYEYIPRDELDAAKVMDAMEKMAEEVQ